MNHCIVSWNSPYPLQINGRNLINFKQDFFFTSINNIELDAVKNVIYNSEIVWFDLFIDLVAKNVIPTVNNARL